MSHLRTVTKPPVKRRGRLRLLPLARGGLMLNGMANPFAKLLRQLRPKRRWAQFSLATLLALMTVVCAVLGLEIVPSERQRRAVAAIETLQGKVLYFGEVPAREAWYQDLDDMPRPLMPDFLRRWLPRDYFDRVQEVNFSGTWAGDADLAHLPALGRLRRLDLVNTRITDAGLAHVSGLTGLRVLSLRDTAITDAGLSHLRTLANLQMLVLNGTKVTGTGLAQVRELTKLRTLYLVDAPVTNAGMVNLSELTGLEALFVGHARITDSGFAHLQRLSGLKTLGLNGTGVTDRGLAQLSALTGLELLNLQGTAITDAGLVHLRELASLRWLLLGSRVTAAGVAELRRALPKCEIEAP